MTKAKQCSALAIVLVIGLVWVAALASDWWMRFHWFRWQDSWVLRAGTNAVEVIESASSTTHPAHRGGDLTRLIGLPAAAAPYEEERPSAVIWKDEFGYRNMPPTVGRTYPIVVVGDSYMADGATMEDTFPAWLAKTSGRPVYNHAIVGWGSFVSVARFLQAPRFRKSPPKVLVFGIVEREVSGVYFEGLNFQLYTVEHGPSVSSNQRAVIPSFLYASALRRSLPRTSALAQISARWWNRARYYLLGRMHPYVIPVEDRIGGHPTLFYFPSIDAMKWDSSMRDVPRVAQAVKYLDRVCAARDIALTVVLIPDKEQVYREWIPESYVRSDSPIPPSCLDPLEAELRRLDIRAINLLGVFRAAARAGAQLYWADDTHWNPRGIDLAAREVWSSISNLFNSADASAEQLSSGTSRTPVDH